MKIAIDECNIRGPILELLRPWKFSIADIDSADVVITRGKMPTIAGGTVVVPCNSSEFSSCVKENNLKLSITEKGQQLQVPINESHALAITPENLYSYGETGRSVYAKSKEGYQSFLRVDIVAEYYRILNETYNARPSRRYRLFTSLPIPYTKAPKMLRDMTMASKSKGFDLDLSDKLPLDALRFALRETIEKTTGLKMELTHHSEKKTAYLITHDIETRDGLNRASTVKKIEEKYDVASTWFVPSNHFILDSNLLAELSNHGELAAHDTKHDGKLAGLRGLELTERLREAKRTLEKITRCSIRGFRSPLLQHNFPILEALTYSSYAYDSSTPTFEPNHPLTMGPHGIGTVYPTKLCGILEIPVTITQDHQLLYTLGLKPSEMVKMWEETASLIKTLGGCCVTLSHPEYKLFNVENLFLYEELLNVITSDNQISIALPNKIAQF